MLITPRQEQILDRLSESGSVSVSEISKTLGVSTVTIRNDLNALSAMGLLARSRGGAAAAAMGRNVRRKLGCMVEEKKRIARAAADMICDGDCVMILAGTTCAGIIQGLFGKRDVQIVTNSTLIMQQARSHPAISVIMAGGHYAPFSEALVGPIALQTLDQFHVDKAFVGTDGFTLKSGITAELSELAEVARKMIAQARRAILVADSTKYGKAGFARIAPISALAQIITDAALPAEARAELEASGVPVALV